MSIFDPISDSTNSLKTEGQEINLTFKQGVPVTGQGTVEWNIPAPAHGCTSDDFGAYAGIVILLHTEPVDASNIPQDGVVYIADPTADVDLSTADKIGGALVVGAIYECEQKSRGEELTISLIINDLKPNESYYVAGYATDCQNRYHSDGIRAYSDMYGEKETDVPGTQVINLGTNGTGVLPTDGTGLVPGKDYEFDIIIDDTYPRGTNVKTVEVTMDGIDAGIYQDLVDNINKQILLVDNPPQSPLPPNSGAFFWDASTQTLFQFDGVNYNPVDVLVEPTDPANVLIGSYWYDTTNKVLNRWNVPNPTGWNVISYIESESNPSVPDCKTYWYDNVIARLWNGSTWCDQETLVSSTDPSECPTIECGTYWYDENINELFGWSINPEKIELFDASASVSNGKWEPVVAIYWPEAPNLLSSGTYWFDDVTDKLFQRAGSVWNDITSTTVIQETEPTVVVDGLLWYKISTEELKQYSAASPIGFFDVPVLVWSEDPTNIESCNLWWNSDSDDLFVWDVVNNEWDQVVRFIQSTLDPIQPAPINVDTIWYNPLDDAMYSWDGGDWIFVQHIDKLTDPTQITIGEGWYKPSTNEWNIWGTPTAGWNVINPTDSDVDPNNILNGTYWYDTTNDALFVRNGLTWTSVVFSTIPFVPKRNSQWYDSSSNILYTWNGTEWVKAIPIAVVVFNSKGGITFTTTGTGSNNVILVPSPEGAASSTSPCSFGTGFAYHGVNDISYAECEYYDSKVTKVYLARDIPSEIFLWNHISPIPNIIRPHGGNDGKSGVPSYAALGVGDDGTPDERRELMDSIRAQLGYPVVEVELTNYQLDTCIQGALESFRKRSSASVRRGFYFLDIQPGKQQYLMTNKVLGYDRIVNISAAYRFTSAFLSSAHGAGVYGQVVLQHLYNMGTYDLTSFFLVSQYVEQLEDLFATRLTFGWHENERLLSFYSSFVRPERVLIDCMTERTEQDLLKDRLIKTWIERYALSEAMMILSHIRGKFASLPGAGGGISLNAQELITISQSYREELLQQVEDFIVDTPEDVGQFASFVLG